MFQVPRGKFATMKLFSNVCSSGINMTRGKIVIDTPFKIETFENDILEFWWKSLSWFFLVINATIFQRSLTTKFNTPDEIRFWLWHSKLYNSHRQRHIDGGVGIVGVICYSYGASYFTSDPTMLQWTKFFQAKFRLCCHNKQQSRNVTQFDEMFVFCIFDVVSFVFTASFSYMCSVHSLNCITLNKINIYIYIIWFIYIYECVSGKCTRSHIFLFHHFYSINYDEHSYTLLVIHGSVYALNFNLTSDTLYLVNFFG